MRLLTYFIAGALFAVGLVIAGMTQPSKVVGFLDLFGDWDPSLILVMVGAIAVHSLSYRIAKGRSSPLLAMSFQIPTRQDIDAKLLGGAVLFGMGWGLGGYCPGPAISSAIALKSQTLVFLASLLGTMLAYSVITGTVSGRANRRRSDHELGQPRVLEMGKSQ